VVPGAPVVAVVASLPVVRGAPVADDEDAWPPDGEQAANSRAITTSTLTGG
jgi:hypothetical protein